jgi:hypothetical protein
VENIPSFPVGYRWLIQRELVGYDTFTQLQPWYFIRSNQCFWANEHWAGICDRKLFVFARRQDNDDLACFDVNDHGVATQVIHIQGWTKAGFEVIQEFPDFWEWLKAVIDDIAEWVAIDESTI